MNTTAKRLVERALRLSLGRPQKMRGRSLILAYHNIVPDGPAALGDRPLHLPLSAFIRQLDLIETHCCVAPLADVLAGHRCVDRPSIAITFDDAYQGAVEFALPELVRRALPSTWFVAPGLFGCRSFWWDELAGPRGLSVEARQKALETHGGRYDRIRLSHGTDESTPDLPQSFGCATESQVRALGRSALVTLGAHTWSHPNLTRLEANGLEQELVRPLEWLGRSSAPYLTVIAYPYGLASPGVEAAVARVGYTAGLLVDGGWFTEDATCWRIPRFNVSAGLSEDGLLLRLSGVINPSSSARAW